MSHRAEDAYERWIERAEKAEADAAEYEETSRIRGLEISRLEARVAELEVSIQHMIALGIDGDAYQVARKALREPSSKGDPK